MTAWPFPRLIAHRGAGTLAPENTLAALAVAVRYGYRAVEIDVMLSSEGTPFLIHDERLDRTTNGTGSVARARDAELRALDAGRWHGAFTPDWRAEAEQLGCVAIHSKTRKTTRAHIAAVRQAGFALACYTVNDPGEAEWLFAAGVDAIFTDRPDRNRAD